MTKKVTYTCAYCGKECKNKGNYYIGQKSNLLKIIMYFVV